MNGTTTEQAFQGTTTIRVRPACRLLSSERKPDRFEPKPDRFEPETRKAGTIRLAPPPVPTPRRKQVAAVFFHLILPVISVIAFFCAWAYPLLWPLIIPYTIRLATSKSPADGKLSSRSERLRSLPIWTHFAGYFPMKLHKTHDLPPNRKYILGYHPHGIISHGAWCAFATNALGFSEKFPGITNSLLTLNMNFRVPFVSEWIQAMGLQSVSRESISNILSKGGPDDKGQGRAVTICIGGAREMYECRPKTMRLVLKDRKGFVKMALKTGADLVPVIGFGENDLYNQVSPKTFPLIHRLQKFLLERFGIAVPLLHGRGLWHRDIGLMPYRREVNIVVGKPIRVDQCLGTQSPQQEVDRLHELYIEELERLYAAHKDQFGEAAQLELISSTAV